MKKLHWTLFLSIILFAAHSFAQTTIPQPDKQAVYTASAPAPIGTYSQAIATGKTVYISGQIAIDPKTSQLVQNNFSAQVRQAFQNVSAITKAAGGDVDDIVKLTIYVTDLNNFAVINEVMAAYFHEPYPARAVIGVKELPKQAGIEIEAVMKKR